MLPPASQAKTPLLCKASDNTKLGRQQAQVREMPEQGLYELPNGLAISHQFTLLPESEGATEVARDSAALRVSTDTKHAGRLILDRLE